MHGSSGKPFHYSHLNDRTARTTKDNKTILSLIVSKSRCIKKTYVLDNFTSQPALDFKPAFSHDIIRINSSKIGNQ